LSLWAHRGRAENYFIHPIGNVLNAELLKNLRKDLRTVNKGSPYEILLIDDIIGSTRTMKQAIDFIKSRLKGLPIRITCLVLFSKASGPRLEELKSFFPNMHPEPLISSRFASFIEDLRTPYEFLPYRKEIHGDLQQVETHRVLPTPLLRALRGKNGPAPSAHVDDTVPAVPQSAKSGGSNSEDSVQVPSVPSDNAAPAEAFAANTGSDVSEQDGDRENEATDEARADAEFHRTVLKNKKRAAARRGSHGGTRRKKSGLNREITD
jgi:hypothetical protein